MNIRTFKLSQIEMGSFSLAGYSVAGERRSSSRPSWTARSTSASARARPSPSTTCCSPTGTWTTPPACRTTSPSGRSRASRAARSSRRLEMVRPLEDLMAAWARVEGHGPAHAHRFVGVREGQDYEIRRGLVARAFGVRHSQPSLGYCVIDVRQKLKEQYLGLAGPQIVELKKAGTQITDRVEYPLVAYPRRHGEEELLRPALRRGGEGAAAGVHVLRRRPRVAGPCGAAHPRGLTCPKCWRA